MLICLLNGGGKKKIFALTKINMFSNKIFLCELPSSFTSPTYQLFMNLFLQHNYNDSVYLHCRSRTKKSTFWSQSLQEKLSLARKVSFTFFLFPSNIACCFRYDFFNYVLTSGSKSNMAQFSSDFLASPALTRHRFTVIIQKPRMKITLMLYSRVSIALESKNWILISLSPRQSSDTTTENVYTQQKIVWLTSLYVSAAFFSWGFCKNSSLASKRIFSQTKNTFLVIHQKRLCADSEWKWNCIWIFCTAYR